MEKKEINPVVAIVAVVVVLLVAGGIWYFAANPAGGGPGVGQPGGADPALSGPNNILKQGGAGQRPGTTPPGSTAGAGTTTGGQ